MNGYLVLLRGDPDDLPLALFDTWEKAHDYAMTMSWNPTDWDREALGFDGWLFDIGNGPAACIAIVSFEKGFVAKVDVVRSYSGDGD